MKQFKLLLILTALVIVMNIPEYEKAKELVTIEMADDKVIPRTGRLIVPTILKWDEPLVNQETLGTITVRVKEMVFIYKRSEYSNRNEYLLTKTKLSEIGVRQGDNVEIDFSKSNMKSKQSFYAHLKVEK